MRETDLALGICHFHNVLHSTDAQALVKRWVHCGRRGTSVSLSIYSEVDCLLVPCYERVEYEEDYSTLERRFAEKPLPTLVVRLSSCVVRSFACISQRLRSVGA